MFWQFNKGQGIETYFYFICYPLFQSYVTTIYITNHFSCVLLVYFAIQTHLNQLFIVVIILFCEIQPYDSDF